MKHKSYIFLVWFVMCSVLQAQPELTNTEATNIDQAAERQAWREALQIWTDDAVAFGSLSLTTDLPITEGGTGASDAPTARSNLGLGSLSTQNSNAVSITGGTISGLTSLSVSGDIIIPTAGDYVKADILWATDYIFVNPNGQTNSSTSIGNALQSLQAGGSRNFAGGDLAGEDLTTGTDNILLGYQAGHELITGSKNVVIGSLAGHVPALPNGSGSDNVVIGYDASGLDAVFAGKNQNVVIGSTAASTASNTVLLGYGVTSSTDNQAILGNASITSTILRGTVSLGSGTWNGATFSGAQSFSSTVGVTGDLTVDTSTLYVDSANNRVGIGTTSPSLPLHIPSQMTVDGMPVAAAFGDSVTPTKRVNIGYNVTNDEGEIAAVQSGSSWKNLVLNPYGGSVGIGGSPVALLSLKGTSTYDSVPSYDFVLADATTTTKRLSFGYDGTNDLSFIQSVHESVTFDKILALNPNDGNVGINTASPTTALMIGASGSLGFTANSGTWNGATFAGAQSFSSTITATGSVTGQGLVVSRNGSGQSIVSFRDAGNSEVNSYNAYSDGNFYFDHLAGTGGINIRTNSYQSRVYIQASDGAVGLGTTAPTQLLDINSDSIRIRTAKTPSSASDTGTQGQIAWDADYIYICTATNTWKRVAIATW